ncbi:MAG: CarboxypepD reg-like domain, partial [Gemmatimonadetes bacterium]|nr:CarboxypepD reg-like domain [Gemmatimonadota bacterium]
VLAAACADSAPSAGGAPLVGIVRQEGDGQGVPGAAVTAWWTVDGDTAPVRRTERADFRGIYRFCGTPAGVPVHVGASAAGMGAAVVEVRLASGEPAQQDLTVPRRVRPPTSSVIGFTQDVATVWGRVLAGGSGAPIAGATVRLGPDIPPQTTDRAGHFRFDRVPAGAYDVVVTQAEYGERRSRAQVPQGGLDLELRMPPRTAVALAGVTVTARPLSPAQVVQRTSGARVDIVTRDDLQRARGAPDVQNVLRTRVPALKVIKVFYPNSAMIDSVVVLYRRVPIAIYMDDALFNAHDFQHLPPDQVEAMEFFPEGYRSYGVARQPVLLLHSRQRLR